jgi:ice-binding like protein
MTPILRRAIPVLLAALAIANSGCGSKSERTPTGPQPPASGEEGRLTSMDSMRSMVAPPLGLVRQFGVLGASGVTAAGTAVIAGDVGSCPTPSITGAISATAPFTVHPAADAVVCQAQIDATTAVNNLNSQGPGSLLPAQLGGTTVGPGVYSFATSADIAAGGGAGSVLTLSGAGSYIFLVPTSLTANVLSSIALIGVDPCEVFWRVGSAATLNGGNFVGTVFAGTSVNIGSGNLTGRAVAQTGSVTMAGPVNSVGGCSALVPGGGPVPALPQGAGWALLVVLLSVGVYILSRH